MSTITQAPALPARTRKQKLTLIHEAFDRLYFLNNKSWTSYREKCLALAVEEEKGHRGHDFARYHPGAVSIQDAARLFVVKRIAEYLNGEKMPHGKDFLHVQRSCFYAAGLVDEYGAEIREAWQGLDLAELAALDYCEFVRVKG